ncbi:hypothetical protein Tco_0491202 [Tanacetum coccineum]
MKKDEREWKGKVLTIDEFTLSSLEVLEGFSFFLQMGFTLILATFDGLDVSLLEDVIGEDDCDEEMSLVRMEWLHGESSYEDDKVDDSRLIVRMSRFFISLW